jgi:hypothetical protein
LTTFQVHSMRMLAVSSGLYKSNIITGYVYCMQLNLFSNIMCEYKNWCSCMHVTTVPLTGKQDRMFVFFHLMTEWLASMGSLSIIWTSTCPKSKRNPQYNYLFQNQTKVARQRQLFPFFWELSTKNDCNVISLKQEFNF